MKKLLMILLGVICFSLVGCTENNNSSSSDEIEKEMITLTFRQEGYEDIVQEVEVGNASENIPDPKEKKGYTVEWSVFDFDLLTTDTVITVVETPKVYTITFELNKDGAEIDSSVQEVTYGSEFTLPVPTCARYVFVEWVFTGTEDVFTEGIYTYDENISLTAVWRLEWSGQH